MVQITEQRYAELLVAERRLPGCRAMLRESAKQFRALGDKGHAVMCDRHADAASPPPPSVARVPAPVPAGEGLADDLRSQGWSVAVHNDYRLNGEPHTFWLFTKGDRNVKGEGKTDAEALNEIRAALAAAAAPAGEAGKKDAGAN